jgi:sirohydrochlorin cobaltochelatase
LENSISSAFPHIETRRAFISQPIIDKLYQRHGLKVPSVPQALDSLKADGFTRVLVQPTLISKGFEHEQVANIIASRSDALLLGLPLLSERADYLAVSKILIADCPFQPGTGYVFVGHGSADYEGPCVGLAQALSLFSSYIYVVAIKGNPTVDDAIRQASACGAKRLILRPFMITAGEHAVTDMGVKLKTRLAQAGYEVECVFKGIGSIHGIQEIFVQHAAKALELCP